MLEGKGGMENGRGGGGKLIREGKRKREEKKMKGETDMSASLN